MDANSRRLDASDTSREERDWASLRAALGRGLTIVGTRPDGFTACTSDGDRITVDRMQGQVVPWVVVRVPICEQRDLEPERVLERNGTLGFSTLVLMQGAYWLRFAVPFDSVELDDPPRLVALCVQAARFLSPTRVVTMTGARADAHFAHYAD